MIVGAKSLKLWGLAVTAESAVTVSVVGRRRPTEAVQEVEAERDHRLDDGEVGKATGTYLEGLMIAGS